LTADPRGHCSAQSGAALTRITMIQLDAYAMIGRRGMAAGIDTKIGNHTFELLALLPI
jgi:hypothetical protein